MHLTMKLELVVRKDVSHVELVKDERLLFGIKLRDGTGDQEGPVIKKVKSKSLAERCHAVSEGDVLLSLNGREVVGMRCKNIQSVIREVKSKINLKLQYRMREACISRTGVLHKQRMTTKLKKMGFSFGFVLRKRDYKNSFKTEFPVISNIKQGGPAHRDGLMQDGDRLLKIDKISLSWLSLADIANILMKKMVAEFTFEYNVREIDFPESPEKMIALDVDIPSMDLGIVVCDNLEKSCGMGIGSIRSGSVAERCGVFSLGDIILSINDIDVKFLTISKANSLLQCGSKIQKISFISSKGRKLPEPISFINCCHKGEYSRISGSSTEILSLDNKHISTPVSVNNTVPVSLKHQTQDLCKREQVKAIKNFYDILKYMTDLKQNLSQLTCTSFENKERLADKKNCTLCNKTQYSVKLCASCISKVNVKCAQTMNLLRNIVANSIKMSLKQENLLPPYDETQTTNNKNLISGTVLQNLTHSLTEILPKVFDGKLELQTSFQALAQTINKANASCNSCKNKIDSASLTVQRLLLLISLSNPTTEIRVLIDQLVSCLLETKLTCEEDADSSESLLEENSVTESENANYLEQLLPRDEGDESATENVLQNIKELESKEIEAYSNQDTHGCISRIPHLNVNLNKQSAYFNLVDIQSFSETDSSSAKEQNDVLGFNIGLSNCFSLEERNGASAADILVPSLVEKSKSNKSKELIKSCKKKMYKDKKFLNTKTKVWRSLESVLHPNKSSGVQTANLNESNENTKQHETESSDKVTQECLFMDPPQSSAALNANYTSRSSKRNGSESNHESIDSFKVQTEKEESHTETMQVNIRNEGRGFGFVLGFSSLNFSDTLPIPTITKVKSKSPAHKIGIIAEKDRVLAINSQKIVGMPLKDIENLKRHVFNSDHITLTIEFDVVDTPLKFGTFDVVLDKTLKIGLIFRDMQEGSPMIVSGLVKGSASHRSGKIFPGDKVTLLRCVRSEEFDPFTCNYTKEEFVKITVQRDLREVIEENPISSNPFSFNPVSNGQTRANFIVRHSAVRSTEGNDALVFDQEVTLFRDPVSWDFGFLVGDNPVTGRAYIMDIRPNGPASMSGVMKKFDRLVEVNGVEVSKNEGCSVLSLLTQANDKVDLLIRRLYRESLDDVSLTLHIDRQSSYL